MEVGGPRRPLLYFVNLRRGGKGLLGTSLCCMMTLPSRTDCKYYGGPMRSYDTIVNAVVVLFVSRPVGVHARTKLPNCIFRACPTFSHH